MDRHVRVAWQEIAENGPGAGVVLGEEVIRRFDQDMPIWEHERYQPSPALAPSEKPITELRRWATQIYFDDDRGRAAS